MPIRHKKAIQKQPMWPEVARRLRQALLCEAPPTKCGCDSGYLRKRMRKAAGEVLSRLGYTIRQPSLRQDITNRCPISPPMPPSPTPGSALS